MFDLWDSEDFIDWVFFLHPDVELRLIEIHKETDKAWRASVFVETFVLTHWFPKSVCTLCVNQEQNVFTTYMTVPSWLYQIIKEENDISSVE